MLMFIVILIFAVFMLMGYKRGLFRSILKLVLTGLSFMLAYFLAPFVGSIIVEHTNIDEYFYDKIYMVIQSEVEKRVSENIQNTMQGMDANLMQQLTAQTMQTVMASEPDRNTQISIIQSSGLPSYIKDALVANNNDEVKSELGTYGFYDYMATYVSYMFVNAISFVVTLGVVRLLLGALSFCLSFVFELPIVGSINRLGGVLFGAAEGLLIVWLVLLIISLFEDSEMGRLLYEQIYSSRFLTLLYERNVFVMAIEELAAIIKI